MRIGALSKKYGLSRRDIDYYTTLGFVKCTQEEKSGYRVYGPDAEEMIQKILILRGLGMSEREIKGILDNPLCFNPIMLSKYADMLREEAERIKKHYDTLISYTNELMSSHSKDEIRAAKKLTKLMQKQ